MPRPYPFTTRWTDGTTTTFASEADHVARVVRCRHADSYLTWGGPVVLACWKCLSAPMWTREEVA